MTAEDEVEALMGVSLHDGRFVVSGRLGAGSQGDTLEAVDKLEGCAVAIKRFQVRGARSWKEVELAEREARVLSSLEHPLLPRALDHFEQDGALYLVMDKVEGRTLREVGRLSRAEVIAFLHDSAEVLEYLHGRGPAVVHRDIKPGNVIARPARPQHGEDRQRYVLVDFGSVRDQLKPAGGSTVVGTFGYMAPEQFQGRARPASAVYAVGATALTMPTGVEPEALPHRGLAIDVEAALGGDAQHADPALVRVLSAMLEPDPDKRPSRIRPLLAQLTPASRPQQHRATPAAGPHSAPPGQHYPPPKRTSYAPQPAAGQMPPDFGGQSRKQRRRVRRAARRASRKAREARQAEKMRDALHNLRAAPPTWLPWPFRMVALLAIWIARLAVGLVVGMVVPLLLTMLSLLFGKRLRDAAKTVRQTSRDARVSLQQVRYWLKGKLAAPVAGAASAPVSSSAVGPSSRSWHQPARVRVEDDQPGRARVAYDDAERVAEQEAEAAMHEANRRRSSRWR